MNSKIDSATRNPRRIPGSLAVLGGLTTLLVMAPASVQAQDVDSRWLPWVGCWEVLSMGAEAQVVCIQPHEDDAAVAMNYADPDVEDLVLHADGTPRQVTQAGCEGEETATFSPDGRRIYIDARYVCDGGAEQVGTGLISMISEDEWIEIRSLSVDGEEVAWVQRYIQATPAAVQAAGETDLVNPDVIVARRLAARAPTLQTLAEVAFAVDAKVASAWIVESGYPFKLNGRQLLALADAGVEPEVIDVAVAVSNPDRFNIGPSGDPTRQAREARTRGPVGSYGFVPYFGRRFYNYGSVYSPWGFMYSPFGYNSYYDPYYAYNYGYGGYRPTYLVVTPRSGGDSGGRAVAGQGYTRGRGTSAPSSSQRGWEPPRSRGSSGGSTSTGTTSSGGSSDPPPRT
ncbi:MAG TPA: hypothetical protein VLA43_14910, partial [Longimicrobiales bacterium]|nr:hypothetical protein [Longimicrobiales bacterium]